MDPKMWSPHVLPSFLPPPSHPWGSQLCLIVALFNQPLAQSLSQVSASSITLGRLEQHGQNSDVGQDGASPSPDGFSCSGRFVCRHNFSAPRESQRSAETATVLMSRTRSKEGSVCVEKQVCTKPHQ